MKSCGRASSPLRPLLARRRPSFLATVPFLRMMGKKCLDKTSS